MGVVQQRRKGLLGRKGNYFRHYLPWTRPLKTWLFPARVASHSTEERSIWDSDITTCFMSGRRMGSSSTHCFASIATYVRKCTK